MPWGDKSQVQLEMVCLHSHPRNKCLTSVTESVFLAVMESKDFFFSPNIIGHRLFFFFFFVKHILLLESFKYFICVCLTVFRLSLWSLFQGIYFPNKVAFRTWWLICFYWVLLKYLVELINNLSCFTWIA